jgi:hypothetical protein
LMAEGKISKLIVEFAEALFGFLSLLCSNFRFWCCHYSGNWDSINP